MTTDFSQSINRVDSIEFKIFNDEATNNIQNESAGECAASIKSSSPDSFGSGAALLTTDDNEIIEQIKKKEENEKKSPMYTAIFNMLAGCGIVGLPITFKQTGIIPGVLLMAIVAGFSVYTFRLLIKNGQRVNVMNYEDLCQKCWGVYGYYDLIITMLLVDVGQCLTYSIILGNSAHAVMSRLFGLDSFSDRQFVILGAYILFLLPFSLGKDFRFIEKISALAIFSIVFMIGVVTFEYFNTYKEINEDMEIDLVSHSVTDMVHAFGAISFAFTQQDQTFLVYKTLINPTINRFTILASWAMGIQLFLYAIVGIFGYMSFGNNVQDDILKQLNETGLVLATRILYTFTMIFIFPTAFYVVRHIIYSSVFYRKKETFEDATLCWRLLFTIGPLAVFLMLSLWITNVGMVMTVIGLIAVVNLTFILPCWIHLHLTQHYIRFWKEPRGQRLNAIIDTWPSVALLVFGTVSAVIGVIGLFI